MALAERQPRQRARHRSRAGGLGRAAARRRPGRRSERPSGSLAELRRRRDELAERVAELTWDLGGLTYEMAIRDHYRLDVLARRAAELQQADAAARTRSSACSRRRGRRPRPVPLVRRRAQPRRRVLLALRRRRCSKRRGRRPCTTRSRFVQGRLGSPELADTVGPVRGLQRNAAAATRRRADRATRRFMCWAGFAVLAAALAVAAPALAKAHRHHRHTLRTAAAGGCPMLPADNPLNQEVAGLPASPLSASYVASIGASAHLHPDFGTNPGYGIPTRSSAPNSRRCRSSSPNTAPNRTPGPIRSRRRADRGRRHAMAKATATCSSLQEGSCKLYELYSAHRSSKARLESRLGRRLRPAQQRAAPRRLDLRRRGRAADLPAAGALPGGRPRRRSTTRCA